MLGHQSQGQQVSGSAGQETVHCTLINRHKWTGQVLVTDVIFTDDGSGHLYSQTCQRMQYCFDSNLHEYVEFVVWPS